jgi:hypothetical protein
MGSPQPGELRPVDIHIDVGAIPVVLESDADSGEVTAFNDALNVMAVGTTAEDARSRFHAALVEKVTWDLARGRPLPDLLRPHVRTPVSA